MTARRAKRIIVCADDFGLTASACQSAIALAEQGAITATSCAVDGPHVAQFAPSLLKAWPDCSLGLHLNLTENPRFELNAGLKRWLLRGFVFRSIDRSALIRELTRQLDIFETLFERAPDFIDGHEHVHQFPGVRESLIECLLARYGTRVAVRSTVPLRARGFKATTISALGGKAMRRLLSRSELKTNNDFAGVYDFSTRIPYEQRMRAWLDSLGDGGLLMCHPELPQSQVAAHGARETEHAFLQSAQWPQLLQDCNAQLVPFRA